MTETARSPRRSRSGSESSRISDGLRIEEHQVGVRAFADASPPLQAEALGGHAGHFVHRICQREEALLPAVVARARGETFPTAGDGVAGRWAGHRSRSWSPDVAGCGAHPLQTCVVDGAGGLQTSAAWRCGTPQARAICSSVWPAISGMRFRPGDDDTNALVDLANIECARRGRVGIAVALTGLFRPRRIQCVENLCAPAPSLRRLRISDGR